MNVGMAAATLHSVLGWERKPYKGLLFAARLRKGKGAVGTDSGRRPGVYGRGFLMAGHFASAAVERK
jgi:hypothetical protein